MSVSSSTFSIVDWSESNVEIADGSEGLLVLARRSRGAPWIAASGSDVVLRSTDGQSSSVRYDSPIGAIHTLEFTVAFGALPARCEDADSARIYIGCLNMQGGATGVLFARNGLAVTGDPAGGVVTLSGSDGLLPPTGGKLVVRLVVNGRGGTAALYATLEDEVPVTGHVLRRTVALPRTRGSLGDQLYVEAIGSGDNSAEVYLSSLRLGDGLVLPAKRPVAVPSVQGTAGVGARVQLIGTESRAPGGEDLSFTWRVIQEPATAATRLTGAVRASVSHGGILLYAKAYGWRGNGKRLVVVDPGEDADNAELSLEYDSPAVTATLAHASAGVHGRTTDLELVTAINEATDRAYVAAVAEVVEAVLTGEASALTAATAGVVLSGGKDSADVIASFIPTVAGLYRFGLVVNIEGLASAEVEVDVNVLASAVEIGRTPDLSFLWDYLPDFSKSVANIETMELVWQAALRITASEYMRLVQTDYAKSIRDVPAQMQHKWASFPVAAELVPTASYTSAGLVEGAFVYSPTGAATGRYVLHKGQSALPAGRVVAVAAAASTPVWATVLSDQPCTYSTSSATFSSGSADVWLPELLLSSVRRGDSVFVWYAGAAHGFSVADVLVGGVRVVGEVGASASGTGVVQIGGLLALDSALSVNYSTAVVVASPCALVVEDVEGASAGDVVIFRDDLAAEASYRVVRHVTTDQVVVSGDLLPTGGASVLRLSSLPVGPKVQHVPRLQLLLDSDTWLAVGDGYTLADECLQFTVTTGSCAVLSASSLSVASAVAAGATLVLQEAGPAGRSWLTVVESWAEGVCVVSAELPTTGTVLSYTAYPVPYARLASRELLWWAEYAYTDNSDVIEANFGAQVGLSKVAFDAAGGTSYLAAVKALHYALWMGPTLSNLELGVQALLGLPFLEIPGTVTEVNKAYAEGYTRFLVLGADGLSRAFVARSEAGVALHPDTGVEIAEGDELPAYTQLTAGVRVSDYVRDPAVLAAWLSGVNELKKFHTFIVSVDLASITSTSAMGLVRSFLERLRPKHTNYTLVGQHVVADEVDVQSELDLDATQAVPDHLHFTPDGPILTGTVAAASATTITLSAGAPTAVPMAVGLVLQTTTSAGLQFTRITGHAGGMVSVAEWPIATPAVGSAYAVLNPPPFCAGGVSGLDQTDGHGGWNKASRAVEYPQTGEGPTCIIVSAGGTGRAAPGDELRLASGAVVGRVKENHYPYVYLDVAGGSLPEAGETLTGSRCTIQVGSASLGQWPDYSYISRCRSEVWIPLDHDSIVGPSSGSATISSYALTGPGGLPEMEVGAAVAAGTYTNYRVVYESSVARVLSHDGTVLLLSADIGASSSAVVTLHPPKPRARLLGLDFFEPGSWVTGATTGHRAQVAYFGPSYLLLRNPSFSPYAAFMRGEQLVGEGGEYATAVDDAFYVYPDAVGSLDREHSIKAAAERKLCFYAGEDGSDPTLDSGLVLDDMELFSRPYDPALPMEDQMVPSLGPGLYWWADHKLVYNAADEAPAGPSPEPAWSPVPEVVVGTLHSDVAWNTMVLHDTGICRVVADGAMPTGSPVPDPVIEGAI